MAGIRSDRDNRIQEAVAVVNLEKINTNRHILISIHDHDGVRVGFLDNEKPGALHYYNDSWHRYLTEGSSTFDFTVWKGDGQDVSLLNEEAYVSFSFEYHEHLFKIRKIEETETELTCYCESTNLELLNEDSPTYEATKEYSLAEYFELGHLVGDTRLSNVVLGTNQVSDVKKKLSWSGTESKLARLLSIVDSFDAECEFVTELNRNGTLNCLKINVYKKHDDDHQGVGTRRVGKTLYYGEGINSIRRTVDITDIISSITPTGSTDVTTKDKDGKETTKTETVTLKGNNPDKVYDSDKHLLYYVENGAIWAPQTRDRFPATLTPDSDKWIVQAYQTDGKSQKEVYELGLERLKVLSEPAIEYEIEGDYDLEIGDTIVINDQKFNPPLLLEARVSEQEYCFTDPTQCRNVFSNVKALENKLSLSIQNRMETLIDEANPITLDVTVDGSTVFRNGSGTCTLTGRLMKSGNEIEATSWAWYNDNDTKVSDTEICIVSASDINGESTYRCEAVKGEKTYTHLITIVDVKENLEITSISQEYNVANKGATTLVEADWSDDTKRFVDGKEVWTRYKVTYEDGTTSTTTAVNDSQSTETTGTFVTNSSAGIASVKMAEGQVWFYAPYPTATKPNLVGKIGYCENQYATSDMKMVVNDGVGFVLARVESGNLEDFDGTYDNTKVNTKNIFSSTRDGGYVSLDSCGDLYIGSMDTTLLKLYGIDVFVYDATNSREISLFNDRGSVTLSQTSSMSLNSTFTPNSDSANCLEYNDFTRVAILHFDVRGTVSANTDTRLCTIPSAYRPSKRVYGAGYTGANGLFINVGSDGEVYIKSENIITTPKGTVCWTY